MYRQISRQNLNYLSFIWSRNHLFSPRPNVFLCTVTCNYSKLYRRDDDDTLRRFIRNFVSKGDLKRSFQYFEQLKYRDVQSYNLLLNLLLKKGDTATFENLYRRMKEDGVHTNKFTIPILARFYTQTGQLEKVLEIYKETRGTDAYIDFRINNYAIKTLLEKDRFDEAKLIFDISKEKKQVTIITYSHLINYLVKRGDLNNAKTLYLDMKKLFKPDEILISILFYGFLEANEVEECFNLFQDMKHFSTNYEFIEKLFHILLVRLYKLGRLEEADKLIHFVKSELGFKPNLETYRIILDGLLKMEMIEEMKAYFQNLKEDGFIPNKEIIQILFNGLSNNIKDIIPLLGNTKELQKYCNQFLEDFCYQENNTADQIYELSSNLLNMEFHLDLRTFHCVLASLLKRANIQLALLFLETLKNYYEPTTKTYEILIDGFISLDRIEVAEKCLEIGKQKVELSPQIFRPIIQYYLSNKNEEAATKLTSEMKELNIPMDARTYSNWIVHYHRTKQAKKMMEMAEEMQKNGFFLDDFLKKLVAQ